MTLFTKRDLMDALPRYYDDSPEVEAIMDANATEIDRVRRNAREVTDQFYVNTATHGLDDWERVLALSPRPNSTIEFRRNRIIARLNGTAPATVAYLTEVVNAHVADKSARIVEYNGEYRFEVEIPVDQLRDTGVIYREINEVKPAHLAFGISAIIREVIKLTARAYEFGVPYPITNTFRTADITGGLARINIGVGVKPYTFEVVYPITNVLTVSGMSAGFSDGVDFAATANSNKVTYARVGVATAWGGDLTATMFADFGGISAAANSNGVLYPRIGEAETREGTD